MKSSTVLVTGASGNLGGFLLPLLLRKHSTVYALYHHSKPALRHENLHWIEGDVTKEDLGLASPLGGADVIYHLAGSIKLGEKYRDEVARINAAGTYQVCKFAIKHHVRKFVHISTAYLFRRNPYEISKEVAEIYVQKLSEGGIFGAGTERIEHGPIEAIIYRPSILISNPEVSLVQLQAVNFFLFSLVKVHRRFEKIRKRLEDLLRLPTLKPVFRILGNPEGTLNLILTEDVAKFIAEDRPPGIYYATNPDPPKLGWLAEVVSRRLLVDIELHQSFNHTPIELAFSKSMSPFMPYLQGDSFKSDIPECRRIDERLIDNIIKQMISL